MCGDMDKLKFYAPTLEQSQEQEIAERKSKCSYNLFKLLKIAFGEKFIFLYDDVIAVKVANDKNQVVYRDESYSATKLACELLIEQHGWLENLHVNG